MKNWWPLAITLAIQAMVAMALLSLPVMAIEVAHTLNVTPALVGIYVAIVYVGAMVASLAAGTAVKRWGAIRVSQLGLLLCAAGLAMCMLPHVPAMVLGAFLIGLGYGPITPASSHLLAKTTRQQHMSLVFSVKQTGVPLGGVLAGAIVPSLAVQIGWQPALLCVAAACLGCIALAQPLCKSLDDDQDPHQPLGFGDLAHPIRIVLQHPALRRLAACSFIFSMVQLSLTTYLATYLNLTLGYGLVAAGVALSFAQVGGMFGRVFWGAIADRWTGALPMLAGLATLMALAALATAALSPGLPSWLILLVLVIFGMTAIGWNGVYLAEIARQAPPGLAGVATGGALAITFLGVVLGPPVFGAIAELTGSYRAAYAALAVPTLLCSLCLVKSRSAAPTARTS